jgi:hypothetical protein
MFIKGAGGMFQAVECLCSLEFKTPSTAKEKIKCCIKGPKLGTA